MGTYRIAEVCLNGHVSTSSADANPELREVYCSKCGERTIIQCPSCNNYIRGYYYVPDVLTLNDRYDPPTYCYNCGRPFPWTNNIIDGALELVKEGGVLSEEEYEQFGKDLDELIKDSPRSQVASIRFKNIMKKVGGSVASTVRDILVNILSEAAKKNIWG